jgi:hypothetical protein
MLGVEMWGDMHPDEDPVAGAAAARKLVGEMVTEAWPEGYPALKSKNNWLND